MCTAKTLYMKELRDSIAKVSAGETGSIVNNGVLLHDYTSDMLEMVWNSVEKGNDAVKAELILMLANLGVSSVGDRVASLAEGAEGVLADACRAYAERIRETDEAVDGFMDVLEDPEAEGYIDAVHGLAPRIRPEDMPRLENVYMKSGGRGLEEMDVMLRMIVARNPNLARECDDMMSRKGR